MLALVGGTTVKMGGLSISSSSRTASASGSHRKPESEAAACFEAAGDSWRRRRI